jgi:hypothetical protein
MEAAGSSETLIPAAECDVLKSISQIQVQREVVKMLIIEYIRRARQLCKLWLKLINLRNKRGRK